MTPTTLEIARKFAEELVGNYDTARLILTLADQVESLTKERDAAMTSKDKFFDESVKHRQERDEYKQRMQRLMTTVTELKKERDFLAIANKDLSEAMENYQQLQAAAKLALDVCIDMRRHGDQRSVAMAIGAEAAIRQAVLA